MHDHKQHEHADKDEVKGARGLMTANVAPNDIPNPVKMIAGNNTNTTNR